MASPGHLLIDRELAGLVGGALRSDRPFDPRQIQPTSVDLRLSDEAYRVRAGFLPGSVTIEERLEELALAKMSLDEKGAVLERGLVYLVRLEERLELPEDVHGRFNPRSSTGRCDIFTRVLATGHERFDETPRGYRGRLWLEVSPLSFPVRLRQGDRLCQLRLQRGRADLRTSELKDLHRETPLAFDGGSVCDARFDDEGGMLLRVGLAGRDPAGWRASEHTEVLEFSKERGHAARDFFEPVRARGGRCILAPGAFYVFASKERLRVPPEYAAEMLPVDVGVGEMRNNYAGFFDSGFGWRDGANEGTPAVLEVRAHDVPFLVEDGQAFFRLRYFRTSGRPDAVYGEGRGGASYRDQDLTLARVFRDD